ncbi:MAG: AAA family ATPase [Planctomycetota bacterium]|nr:MAG: AAA family ATPase [Planctomycetota bacterium]
MYQEHWNLAKKPFENDLDTSFFFESDHHKEARVRLLYCAEQRKPLALLIGESGVGKTYVCRAAAEKLAADGRLVAFVPAGGLAGAELVRTVALAFGVEEVPTHRAEALALLEELLRQSAAKGAHAVLFLDNVEGFGDGRCFDELRTLLDLVGEDGRPLLTVILSAHPRVRGSLKRRYSLVQRLEVGYSLEPLGAEEGRAYVLHRLNQAAAPEHLFDDDALARAVELAEGNPRLLNRICDLALLMGRIELKDRVTAALVEDAHQETRDLKKIGAGGRDRRERDEEADDASARDSEEEERGGRRRRGRERGGRRRRRGRGRERDEDVRSGGAEDDVSDEGAYSFNSEEHRDIQSMTQIIQGTLKVQPTSGRRRRRRSKKDDGDALHYFDSNLDEANAEDEDSIEEAAEEAPKKKRRRRRRRRGRKGEDEGTAKGEAGEAPADDDAGGEDDFSAGLDATPPAARDEAPAAQDDAPAARDEAPAAAVHDEGSDEFAAGL